jgi:hypothetical protein
MIRSFRMALDSTWGFRPKVCVEKMVSPFASTAIQSVFVEPLSTTKIMNK